MSVVPPTNSLIPTYVPANSLINSLTYLHTYSLTNTERNHPQPQRLELSELNGWLPDAEAGTVQGPGQLAMARSGLVCVAREQSEAFGMLGRTVYETVGTFSIREDAGS